MILVVQSVSFSIFFHPKTKIISVIGENHIKAAVMNIPHFSLSTFKTEVFVWLVCFFQISCAILVPLNLTRNHEKL